MDFSILTFMLIYNFTLQFYLKFDFLMFTLVDYPMIYLSIEWIPNVFSENLNLGFQ